MQRTKQLNQGKGAKQGRWLMALLLALVVGGAAAAAGGAKNEAATSIQGGALPTGETMGDRIAIQTSANLPGTGWIEVQGWSWGVTLPIDSASGAATGQASFQEFQFSKNLDQFSPMIANDVAEGKHIAMITFEDFSTPRKGNETVYLRVTFTDCLISSYQISGSSGGGDMPTESITFVYAKIKFEYIGPDSSLSSSFEWDLERNA